MKLKTTTKETIDSLRRDIRQLKQEKNGLLRNISSMTIRRTDISKALEADEARAIGKIAAEITVNFLRWVVS